MRILFHSLVSLIIINCNHPVYKSQLTTIKAPEYFKAKFKTTKGDFEIESYRKWSPLAVDRLYQLIKSKYYTNNPVRRVVPNFVVQFGNTDTILNKKWKHYAIADETVIKDNTKGTVAFARSSKDTRSAYLYINLVDNPKLDTTNQEGVKGFPAIANVTKGMDVVNSFFSYGKETIKIPKDTNALSFLKMHYPKVDYIKRAYIIK